MPVSYHRQRIADDERVGRHKDNEASGLRFVQEDRLARFAVAAFIHEGGVLKSLFLGP
jgi:hypothetical protein